MPEATSSQTCTLDFALRYRAAGLCALPANLAAKRPDAGNWKEYQSRLPTDDELRSWFKRDRAMCLVAGAASKNLEMIDFDCAGEKFAWWRESVHIEEPGLVDKLVVEQSQSSGYHVVYRCESKAGKNGKLAERVVIVPGPGEYTFYGKKYEAREVDGHFEVQLTLIETRGEGGIFLCAPTPGYELVHGEFEHIPVISDEQRELLLTTARSLNELWRKPDPDPDPEVKTQSPTSDRPGDDYNQRGEVRALLRKHGWALEREGVNEYWRRPGKERGTSASLKDGVFYVFSSNAAPFDPDKAYSKYAVYTLLEHGKDQWAAAAAELRRQGYGGVIPAEADVDLSQFKPKQKNEPSPIVQPRFEFNFISSIEFAHQKYPIEYLIDDILVKGQPMVVAAPKKGLKTNTSVDMAIALAEGGLYLGRFNVQRPVRVAMMSAESGEATLQETAFRICDAKYRKLDDTPNPFWAFQVPMLDNQAQLHALRQAIEKHKFEVVILDPTYLMMVGIGDGASNLFLVGSFLRPLNEIAQEYGVTFVLCHHLKKGVLNPYEPAELDDIAWAGFQEYVRQWILLNRRVRYDPARGGHHELWFTYGGSAGHGGCFGLNVDEGTRKDPGGRRWEVELLTPEEAYDLRDQVREAAKEERLQRREETKLDDDCEHALAAMAVFPNGETKNALRDACGYSGARFGRVLSKLLTDGLIEPCEVTKTNGQAYPGFRVTRTVGQHSDEPLSDW